MRQVLVPLVALCLLSCGKQTQQTTVYQQEVTPSVTFNADSAYEYVRAQVDFGPRVPGSESHSKCLDYMVGKLRSLGAEVEVQEGMGTAYDGTPQRIRNVIASFLPEKANRVLLSSHWYSRPFADHDADEKLRDTPISGANDGASGVGVLIEVARQLQQKAPSVGVDIVLFDAEDGGTPDHKKNVPYRPDTWCVGSQFWGKSELGKGVQHRFGILLDMVGAPHAIFPVEQYSKSKAPDVVEKVWGMAERLGHGGYFVRDMGGYITDDHLYVNNLTEVPMVDIIHYEPGSAVGFCKTWHTQQDVIDNISKETLAVVGETVLAVVYAEK